MKKYSYARLIAVDGRGISIETADQELVTWVSSVTKAQFPQCEIFQMNSRFRMKLVSMGLRISNLNNEDYQVGWWILNSMLQKGWEPFSRDDSSSYDTSLISIPRLFCIDLRAEIDSVKTQS